MEIFKNKSPKNIKMTARMNTTSKTIKRSRNNSPNGAKNGNSQKLRHQIKN